MFSGIAFKHGNFEESIVNPNIYESTIIKTNESRAKNTAYKGRYTRILNQPTSEVER